MLTLYEITHVLILQACDLIQVDPRLELIGPKPGELSCTLGLECSITLEGCAN